MTIQKEEQSKTHSSSSGRLGKSNRPGSPAHPVRPVLSARPDRPVLSAHLALLTVLAVLVLGSVLLAASCAPASVGVDQLQVSTYYNSVAANALPVELGQAIEEDGTLSFALADADAILTISNLTDGDHNIHFGSVGSGGANNYSRSYQKTASDGTITMLKSELASNSFSFTDGAVIGISELDSTDIQHVATYRPSSIHNHQDLQAMRKDLARDYVLKQNIVFIPMTDDTDTAISNYEAVGDDSDPFTGSLDGASNSITGIQIEGTDTDNYQGLFGVVEAGSVDIVVAQNLALRDFKITGNAFVGSLAGWMKRGTVDRVRVEVSSPDAGKIEVSGDILIGTVTYGFGGGLIGRAETGTQDILDDTQIRIQNTSSDVTVVGLGIYTDRIGGIAGEIGKNVELTESYATGSVTGAGAVGGLVGYNNGTVVGYATGLVTGRGDGVGGLAGGNEGSLSGYATGSVVGKNTVGGLVGINSVSTSYAIGFAIGSVTGVNNIGGLVGNNLSGTVGGYATGSVTGSNDSIGGLGGSNRGTLFGYSTGDVTGDMLVGGLVGTNGGTLSGYTTGSATGTSGVGGLIGNNNSETVSGYARSIVRRSGGTMFPNFFGKIVGMGDLRKMFTAYSSTSESLIYDGKTGTTEITFTMGIDGTEVTVDELTMESVFAGLTFGTAVGEWTWVADGKWPAINIGDEIKPASEQPTSPRLAPPA